MLHKTIIGVGALLIATSSFAGQLVIDKSSPNFKDATFTYDYQVTWQDKTGYHSQGTSSPTQLPVTTPGQSNFGALQSTVVDPINQYETNKLLGDSSMTHVNVSLTCKDGKTNSYHFEAKQLNDQSQQLVLHAPIGC
jgi:hypothetical protein